jgi:hypothetical protein
MIFSRFQTDLKRLMHHSQGHCFITIITGKFVYAQAVTLLTKNNHPFLFSCSLVG